MAGKQKTATPEDGGYQHTGQRHTSYYQPVNRSRTLPSVEVSPLYNSV